MITFCQKSLQTSTRAYKPDISTLSYNNFTRSNDSTVPNPII
jgi:hypothetical protein